MRDDPNWQRFAYGKREIYVGNIVVTLIALFLTGCGIVAIAMEVAGR